MHPRIAGIGAFETRGAIGAGKGSPAPILPPSSGAVIEKVYNFPYQSYYDSTLLQKALLSQPMGANFMVESTEVNETQAGWAIGLHPSSETPVALDFDLGGSSSNQSSTLLCKPGQIIRPTGSPRPGQEAAFTGFRVGLPWGWLGGGLARLQIFRSPDAEANWSGDPEVVFHRQRMQIRPNAAFDLDALLLAGTLPMNWPLRFPWIAALNNAESQGGAPGFSVDPTRTVLRLRLSTVTALAQNGMRALWYGTKDFDTGSTGAVVTTMASWNDVVWSTSAPVGPAATIGQGEVIEFKSGPWVRFGCEAAANSGLVLVAKDAGGQLESAFIDIERWGRVG